MTNEEIGSAIAAWATFEPLIRRVYLFGSRAKGTSRLDSDAGIAILHNAGPGVLASCDPAVAHWLTWMEFGEGWAAALGRLLSVPAHVHQIDRENRHIGGPVDAVMGLHRR